MKKALPVILIVGGIVIAAITYFGYRAANKTSDVEVLQRAIIQQQLDEERKAADLGKLGKQPLQPPAECADVTTAIFFNLCELEGDAGAPEPDWTSAASAPEQVCILAALHRTNEHAYRLQQRQYGDEQRAAARAIDFACDVAAATLYAEGIGYGDTDARAVDLLTAFFAERTESHYGPRRSY
ncbi:MAG: hypothetical protein HKN49_06060 [Gammaproteobacteria bacterium]|nr:hypothetical protein [Gammaproteobacteria bacterium]